VLGLNIVDRLTLRWDVSRRKWHARDGPFCCRDV